LEERKETMDGVNVLDGMTPGDIAEALLALEPDELSNVLRVVGNLTESNATVMPLRPLSRPKGPLVISAASAGHRPGCRCVTHYLENDDSATKA
jgi:hypothetical protein